MPSEESNDEAAAAIDAANQGSAASRAALAQGLPAVGPDYVEETHGDVIDDLVPTHGYQRLPVVALGASAGGIQALKTFFAALPPEKGTAYVVILHLSPDHESTLPALLQNVTALPVKAAEDGERLQADHVYVIPPGWQLTVTDGHLRLSPLESERGKRVVVDLFFRSLADAHGPHATAVVLSGADGDGAIGIKRIKECGGLTVAQEPGEAEYDSMPRSAIATGMVDWVLPVADMPARILAYSANEHRLRLPPEDGPQPARPAPATQDEEEAALREVLGFLRMRTGNDFTYYKRATLLRRIARRMQINGVNTLPEYLLTLRTHTGEAADLLQDLLISVTNFFRDREAFAAVEARLPTLFAGKGPQDTVRVWCAACATGEEPYSMAMLLTEHARTLPHPPTVQVFGCDLDAQSIQTARAGVYPSAIVADVSEERIARFFIKEPRGYQVRRELRETVLFAQHDLLKDAPFSRLDLVSCRNLLIYLERDAQARAMEIFHFALKPNGLLFLGSAESVEEERGLFATLDKKHRLYVRCPVSPVGLPIPTGTGTLLRALQTQSKEAPFLPHPAFDRVAAGPFAPALILSPSEEQAAMAELHFRLTERYASPSVVVNAEGDIVHLSENAGRFLRPSGGHPTANLLRTIHPALRMDLHAALLRLAETGAAVEVFGLPVEMEGGPKQVDLRVAPAAELAPGYLLVSFDARARDAEAAAADAAVSAPPDAEAVVRHLERELEQARAQLRDTIERFGVTEEEYKSSNEELQSMNEELRSASEELETSREELQSMNEELTTVNFQFKHNVEELGRTNSDLHNLMNASHIATVFVDRELRVIRYTPEAVAMFYLIPSDTGRPLTHLKFHIDYPGLEADARQVLRTLVPLEREVGDGGGGNWFLARLSPYRSLEERIEGVVLTFVDITERKGAERRQTFRLKLSDALRTVADPAEVQQVASRVLCEFFGVNRALYAEVDGEDWIITSPFEQNIPAMPRGRYPSSRFGPWIMEAYQRGEGIAFSDVRSDPRFGSDERAAHEEVHVRGSVGIPLVKGAKVVAALMMHSAEPREWTRDEIALVEETAERTWASVERARAEASVRSNAERQAFLLELSDALPSFDDPLDIQQAAMRMLGQRLDATRAFYFLTEPEEDGNWIHIIETDYRRDPGMASHVGRHSVRDFGPGLFDGAEHGKIVEIADVTKVPLLTAAEVQKYLAVEVVAFINVPLIQNGKFVAGIGVHDGVARPWKPEEIGLIQEVASRTWASVERARAEKALHASEAKLAVELADTQQLQRISSSLIEQNNTGALYDQILEAACTVMRSDMASVQMLVPERNELLLLAHKGFPPAAAKFWEWVRPDSESACGQAESNDVRVIVPDVELDKKAAGTEDLAHYRLAGVRAVQSTQLVSRSGRPVGMLSTHWREAHHPSERELRLFDVLARQAADLIEHRITEEALHASEQRLRTLADAVPQIIWTNSSDGVADYFNRRWHEYSGLTHEQSHGLGWQAIVHPDDAPRAAPAWEKALAAGVIFDTEYRLRGADGGYRWFIGRNVPLKDEANRVLGWFGSATDIHDLKEAEQETELARGEAEAANQAKDHFLAVLSHELRTPLMPITMALATLGRRQDLPEMVQKAHAMIRRNVELETRFIDDMLDVTRIAQGKMEIVRRGMDLHEAIERAVEVSSTDIKAKGQQLTISLEATEHTLSGDFARLQQVFWNLLKNASKFTPPGGAIHVRSRHEGADQVAVEVTDTGIGMDPEALVRVFRPFEQADANITREFGGLGLGLSIAKGTVEAHDGTLRASSPGPGQGATFTVTLPRTVFLETTEAAG